MQPKEMSARIAELGAIMAKITAFDAIVQVLEDSSGPLHYREITRRILKRGLWNPSGKTPEATIAAQLSVDINRTDRPSQVCRIRPGVYSLARGTPILGDISTDRKPRSRLSFTDAAEHVLKQSGRNEPMHYRDITDHALRHGLIVTEGKTPEATMYAQIYSEIERVTKRGDRPRFARVGRGLFALTRWQTGGLAAQIDRHNRTVRNSLLQKLKDLAPTAFEELVARVLTELGFELVEVTRASADGGIDVRGTLVVGEVIRTRMAIQVKRWKSNIQTPTVQQVRGSLGAHEQGLIITTSDYSQGARTEAERADATPVALMNGEQLVRVMIEHDIAINRSSHDIIELGEDEDLLVPQET